MVQTQATAYELVEGEVPTLAQLESNGYIPSTTCENGSSLNLSGKGEVTVVE